MQMRSWIGVGLLCTAVALTGCGQQATSTFKTVGSAIAKGGEHDHGAGPHGGVIIEFGRWHGEFTVDHKASEATIYILGNDAKTPSPIPVDKLQLSIKNPQFQLDVKAVPQANDPEGKSSRFVGKHENFAKEQEFEGTLSGVVNGKPYAGDFKELPEPAPKQEKK